ncbi:MAG: type II toxin-antitoxin system HicA family toxin [Bacillota bacterium]
MSGRRITPVHYTLLVRVFEYDGWKVTRQKGDHLVMTKPGAKRPPHWQALVRDVGLA